MSDLYLRVADPYPLQSAAFNSLSEYYIHLSEGRLTTTRCRTCDTLYWPPRKFCPQCVGDQFEWVDLPEQGTVHAFCIQEAGVPQGFRSPLVLGVIEVAGLRIFGLISCSDPKKITLGQKVGFRPIEVSSEPGGERRFLHAFEPIEDHAV
ncbi:MAG: OB-fold domain-containing protein [Deltaproteobacteria bacterium]|nr:OB-fold domain-containing protein [Deltaproteobacteria bacterium]